MTTGFILNRQYILLEMSCNHFHTFFTKFSYTTFFVTFLFVMIQSFFFFNFSDFPWNSYNWTTTDSKIVLERSVITSNLLLHNYGTEIIGIRLKFQRDVWIWRKWKHVKYVYWGAFLFYQVFFMKTNMYGNKNADVFSICHSCPMPRWIVST